MGPLSPHNDAEPDPRITSLVNEFFDRRQTGEDLTPEQFAAEHPEVAERLGIHLGGLPLIDQACLSGDQPAGGEGTTPRPGWPEVKGYRLLEEIGRGGMGVAYKAFQLSTKRVVALKLTLAGPFASTAARRRFDRVVELAARLQHPGIVRVLEGGVATGQPYYSMDLIEGTRLDRYVLSKRPGCGAVLALFIELCEAVEYAHGHGVIHRDLKPANVLVDAEGRPHILDFGLAKAVGEVEVDGVSACVSSPGQVLGTLFYLAPEQAAGELSAIDGRTDVYALGLMLYEALTGSLPLDTAGRPSDIIQRILEVPPITPRTRSPHIDADLEAILLKTIEKEKTRRYQSARELADDLKRYLRGEPILARRPSRLYVLGKRLRRHRVVTCMVATVLVLVLAAWGIGVWLERRDVEQARFTLLDSQRAVEAGKGKASGYQGSVQKVFGDHPELPEATLVRAQVEFRDPTTADAAMVFLERCLRINPEQPMVRLLLAEMYRTSGKPAMVDGLDVPAEADLPDTAEMWYVRSFATLDTQKALRCAECAVQRDPGHRLAWERLTYLRLLIGDFDGALQGTDRLIQLGGKSREWIILRGHVLARQGRLGEAVADYTRADAYLFRAHAYRRLRRYAEAVDDYTRCLSLEPISSGPNVWAHYQRATPLWILGRTDEALADYRQVRSVLGHPFYGDAREFIILCDVGRQQEAEEGLAASLEAAPDPWLAQIFRCLAGNVTPEDLVAQATANGGLKKQCEAYYYAGEACRLAGRQPEARRFFAACVETGLIYDPDVGQETPMNEYELAQWRLESLAADSPPSQP